MISTKILFFSVKKFFFSNKVMYSNKYSYLFAKNLILLKKIHSVKIFILFKQTHSVKDEFSFATNEQVQMIVKKIKVFFSDSALVIWSSNEVQFCKIETFKSLYKLCQIKNEKESSYFSLRTMFCKCLLPMQKWVLEQLSREENCPPTSKLTPSQTLTLAARAIFFGGN